MKILLTGIAGFIGFHLAKRLLEMGHYVVGLDNINEYYDLRLKYARLAELGVEREEIKHNTYIKSEKYNNLLFLKSNLEDNFIYQVFNNTKIDLVINMAAQAGVRQSLINPRDFIKSNIIGFFNLIDAAKSNNVKNIIFASSSSVYGLSKNIPFSTKESVDKPINIYAASKKTNELFAYTYSHLYGLDTVGLRFFTVYGPWGRPDMAYFKFVKAILEDREIDVYNNGNLSRDFTYVDDIVDGLIKIIEKKGYGGYKSNYGETNNKIKYKIYNIGNSKPEDLMTFIKEIERCLDKKAKINFMPMQPGDAITTYADISELTRDFGYKPKTSIKTGIPNFVEWYLKYYNVKYVNS